MPESPQAFGGDQSGILNCIHVNEESRVARYNIMPPTL
jgi:hypothetical protein